MKPEEEASQLLKDLRSLGQRVEVLERKVETPRPKFTHDCKDCQYLGTFTLAEVMDADLYYCDLGSIATVIARYGNDGPEYQSGIGSGLPWLKKAEALAIEQGFLPWQ